MPLSDPRQFLLDLYFSAVGAVSAEKSLPAYLPKPSPGGRTLVIGAGKGAAAMAKVVEDHWQGDISGLVVTRYGHGADCKRIEVVEAAHPVPDEAGRAAAGRMLQMVHGLSQNDLVLCLISGGGSSLLALPADGITLEQKQAINKALLKSGAVIGVEWRAQASVGHQGRPPGAGMRAGARGDAADFRCAGRRSGHHRQRADAARSDYLRRCAGHPAQIRHRRAG